MQLVPLVPLVRSKLCEYKQQFPPYLPGYLKRQKLEGTSRLFCKTSPHLKHELTVYRSGFTPHSFCPDLEDIICEYVNIKHIGKYSAR